MKNNQSFALMYSLKSIGKTGRERIKDFYEIFCDSVSITDNPETRVKARLKEIQALYESNNSKLELYCWNIAKISATSEHYPIGESKVNATCEFHNLNPANQNKNIDGFEVAGVIVTDKYCERTEEDKEADIFSVYAHFQEGHCDCIADFETKEEANRFKQFLDEIGTGIFTF